jgi:3-dehydroquinate synthase
MSHRCGLISLADSSRVARVVASLGLPVVAPRVGSQRILELMGMDKKVLGGKIRLILLKSLGEACVTGDYVPDTLKAALDHATGPQISS